MERRIKHEVEVKLQLHPPHDYSDPDWNDDSRVHNWRNYIGRSLRSLWPTFTDEQKAAIAENADDIAGREEWD